MWSIQKANAQLRKRFEGLTFVARNSSGTLPNGDPNIEIYHARAIPPSEIMRVHQAKLFTWKHRWLIQAFAMFYRDGDTDAYVPKYEIEATCLLSELEGHVEKYQAKAKMDGNTNHLVDWGWVATILPLNGDSKYVQKIKFEDLLPLRLARPGAVLQPEHSPL